MQSGDQAGRDYFHRIDPLTVEDSADIELAFRLQNARRDDPELLIRLVNRYANDLYRWLDVLVYFQLGADPSRNEILDLLSHVFIRAINHVEQFHGQVSVSGWLFGICYQVVKNSSHSRWIRRHLYRSTGDHNRFIDVSEVDWMNLESTAERQRTPLILRYGFDLALAEIANILSLEVDEVHRRLVRSRRRLLPSSMAPDMDNLIQSYMDGLLDDSPDDLNVFLQHLESCDDCQSDMEGLSTLEKRIGDSLKQKWPATSLKTEEIALLNQLILSKIQQTDEKQKPLINLRQVNWMLGLFSLFIVLAIVFIRLTPTEREFPQTTATANPQIPPIVEMAPKINPPASIASSSSVPQYIAPAFSVDGNWAVFNELKTLQGTWGSYNSRIEIYNREAKTFQVINQGDTDTSALWIWWDLTPSISADGRRIVYVLKKGATSDTGSPCITSVNTACLDIFLYDRESGKTSRLTHSISGGAADGESMAPTISADGSWVAFWSTASNLVEGYKSPCQQGELSPLCLSIYLLNLRTGKIKWIPIGIAPGDPVFGVDRISLSADGRYVGFTTTRAKSPGGVSLESPSITVLDFSNSIQSNHAELPPILQSSEAVVYDQQTGRYELENQAQDGSAGNGPSSSPNLSGDGRYVAFASASSNLVKGDYNKHTDVFVRDRESGAIELASVTMDGTQGNQDSGLTYWGRGYYSINLSTDGRYVVFESTATNLYNGINMACDPMQTTLCNILYVHDRQTGLTERITALPNQDFSFFPEISADGRWMTFMQSASNCNPTQFLCSNVMMYDRQRNWMANLTKYSTTSETLPWVYASSLNLPWTSWESSALSFSPDGKTVILGGNDSKVRVWKLATGDPGVIRDQPDQILDSNSNDFFTTVAISPDSQWVAAGASNGAVYVWQLSSGNLLYKLAEQIDPLDPIKKVIFSADRVHLEIATYKEVGIWTISSNQLIRETYLDIGGSAVWSVDINPQGTMVASAHGDGTVWMQALPSGKLVARLGGQQLTVTTMAFSTDGSLLATRSGEGTINIWQISSHNAETPSFTLLNTMQSNNTYGAFVFSADHKYLASTGVVGEILVWSIPDGNIYTLTTSMPNQMVSAVAFSKTGDHLAAILENELILWSLVPSSGSTFFSNAAADSYTDKLPFSPSSANGFPQSQYLGNNTTAENLSIEQTSAMLGFHLILPTRLPQDIDFLDATVNDDGSAWLRYDVGNQQAFSAFLYIYEKEVNSSSPPTITVGSSAMILPVRINIGTDRVDSEYVQGDWIAANSYTPPSNSSSNAVEHNIWSWDNSSFSQRLCWTQNGIMIELYYQVIQFYKPVLNLGAINQSYYTLSPWPAMSDMEQIASGMVLTGSGY